MALKLPESLLSRTAQPACRYFGQCGGCALQDVPYEQQLTAKSQTLQRMLGVEVPIVPSPQPYRYRHRMDFVVAFGKIGLRKRGDFRTVVDLLECHLVSERVSSLLPKLHEYLQQFDIAGYDYIRHRGDLRYLVMRHAFSTDQLMVTAVTASRQTAIAPLLQVLRESAESVVWSVNEGKADVSFGTVQEIYGLEYIRQRIGTLEFLIRPNTFFQNNLLLLDEMVAHVASLAEGYVLDLYCGVGCLGLACAAAAEKVLGVESVEESILLARRNAEINGIANAEFETKDVAEFLRDYRGPTPDVAIVDPPRSGMMAKAARRLARLKPRRIVYVSCNPKAFVSDVQHLKGYRLTSARAFDMFPQTPHVELIAVLERA